MRKRRPLRPCLERLEDRWVPANVKFVAGNLLISPSAGEAALNLTVQQTAANVFTVKDGASKLGTYGLVGNILITGGNGADTVTVDLNGKAYGGNLFANTGNGNDTVSLTNTSAAAASLGGNVTLLTGLGNDSVGLSRTSTGPLTIGGSVQVTDLAGNDSIGLGNATAVSNFQGNVTLTGMNVIRLAFGKADVFGGNLSASLGGHGGKLDFETAAVATAVTINGSLQLTGGPDDDTVVDSALVVVKDVNINLGGSKTAIFGNFVSENIGSPPLQVGGNFSYTGSGLLDELILSGNSVAGTMSLNLGDGNDLVDLSTAAGSFGSPMIGGNLSITAGNGNDNFNGLFGEGITAAVAGNLSVRLGNGNDTMTVVHAPGGRLFWTSGNGNDSVTLGGAAGSAGEAWNVNMRFGTGNDTMTLSGGTVVTPNTLSGFIDMGGPPAGNMFDPTGSLAAGNWVIVSPFTLQNV